MCTELWGAKVTRRYVPVIASVPPVTEREQRIRLEWNVTFSRTLVHLETLPPVTSSNRESFHLQQAACKKVSPIFCLCKYNIGAILSNNDTIAKLGKYS